MSVASVLGLQAGGEQLGAVCARWGVWRERHGVLRDLESLEAAGRWRREAAAGEVDAVLRALAQESSPRGGDDVAATAALCWLLLPGARRCAQALRSLGQGVDELVAVHLWLEVRSFAWEGGGPVAATVLWRVRRRVLREVGLGDSAEGSWARRVLVDPASDSWEWVLRRAQHEVERADDATGVLEDLLEQAVRASVVSAGDVALLRDLAQACQGRESVRRGVCAGLTDHAVTRAVSVSRGVSDRTVRRRVQRSLAVLREHAGRRPELSCA